MVWVKFTDDFDFRATEATTVAYKKGMTENVTRQCADEAKAAGKAHASDPPNNQEGAVDGIEGENAGPGSLVEAAAAAGPGS